MKKLPLGIQSFSRMIENDYLYVDKTELIHRLVASGALYFFSRPRRFGKSVLISTLEALYLGRKDLFSGLFIEDVWDWAPRPVIRFDLLGMDSRDLDALALGIDGRPQEIAEAHGIRLTRESTAERFRELILTVSRERRAVVLIDEYDKPILDQLEHHERAEEIRRFLATFYSVLKSVEDRLELLFLTGVSNFTRVSLFSDLNNLQDISLYPDYAALAGFTEAEMARYFGPYLAGGIDGYEGRALEDQIRLWYDGYSWDGVTRIYNPVSVVSMMAKRRFSTFWFSTGTPKFLISTLRENKLALESLEDIRVPEYALDAFQIDRIDPIPLLFQAGYLTIKEAIREARGWSYRLSYPNYEVKEAFLSFFLADSTSREVSGLSTVIRALTDDLAHRSADSFCERLQSLFASIPYNMFLPDREAYDQTVIYVVMTLLGARISGEVQTHTGRIDAVLEIENAVWIIELKLGTAAEAMDQIEEKGYATAFRKDGLELFLLGIGLDRRARNISDWIVREA